MFVSTDIAQTPGLHLESDPTSRRQAVEREYRPVNKSQRTTLPCDSESLGEADLTSQSDMQAKFEPPVTGVLYPVSADSMPLQIWEGTVIEVDREAGVMSVVLDAKMGQVPRHSGEIDLEWVSDQDEDLVRPGAVFYLTLFKRTKRGSVENSQELRFRRVPSWSTKQLNRVDEAASMLLSKMKALPTAE